MPENLQRLIPAIVTVTDGAAFHRAICDCNNPLDAYTTQRTAELFDLILKNGRDRAELFLVKDPTWKVILSILKCNRKFGR